MQQPHRKRKKTYNDPGHAHYLTFSCYRRLPLLQRDRTRQWVVEAIDTARRRQDMSVWAYVIMPEHMHLLVCPRRETYRIERLLYDCKRPVSYKAKRWLLEHRGDKWLERLTVVKGERRTFRFWQAGGGYDRNLIRDRGIRAVVEYIHGNPVRRGLVDAPEDWRWSSAAFWNGKTDVPIQMDSFEL